MASSFLLGRRQYVLHILVRPVELLQHGGHLPVGLRHRLAKVLAQQPRVPHLLLHLHPLLAHLGQVLLQVALLLVLAPAAVRPPAAARRAMAGVVEAERGRRRLREVQHPVASPPLHDA